MLFKLAGESNPLLSLFSVFLFLPLSLITYYSFPEKHREKLILVISLGFMLMVAPRQLPFILAIVLINYALAMEIVGATANHKRYRKILLFLSVLINALLWVAFGFLKDFSGYFYIFGGGVIPFLLVDTNLAIYRRKIPTVPSLTRYALYALFFPRLFVGPFDSLTDFFMERKTETTIGQSLRKGFGKFARGGVQFSFLGVRLLGLAETLNNFHISEATKLSAWTIALSLALGIYHTLAGFSTVVEGIGEMFGYKLASGWSYPFDSSSLVEFSRKFHGSLENFLWRNLHVWSLKKRYGKIVQVITVIVIGAIIGLWVDFSLGFVCWGVFVAAFTALEFFLINKRFKAVNPWLKRTFTFAAIVLAFALLTIGYTGWDFYTFSLLFQSNVPFGNSRIFYYLNSYLFLLVLGILLATDAGERLVKSIGSYFPKVQRFLGDAISFVLFVILIILLV